MRDQYAGDISDLLKIAFLRALAAEGGKLGVAWYYNPECDGRPDGRHREFCGEPKWKALDGLVWEALRAMPERSVGALERLPVWPAGTRFHGVPVPPAKERPAWADETRRAFEECDVVFLDPDNGVGKTKRHATAAEIAAMRRPGRAVVLIKFPGRQEYDVQAGAHHDWLRQHTRASSVVTVRTSVWVKTPRLRWFTIIDADDVLTQRARRFVSTLNGIMHCKSDIKSSGC